MDIRSVSAPYGDSGGASFRTPPPDLPSLLLKERIVYLGLPLFSDDDAKRQMGVDVTELIIAQLLYLEFDNPEKPIFFYINSTGTSWYQVMRSVLKPKLSHLRHDPLCEAAVPHLHRPGMGTAAMILSAGAKGQRASLPNASIVLHNPAAAPQQATTFRFAPRKCCITSARCFRCFLKTLVPVEQLS